MCEGCPNFSFYADCLRTSEDDYCQVEEFQKELARAEDDQDDNFEEEELEVPFQTKKEVVNDEC